MITEPVPSIAHMSGSLVQRLLAPQNGLALFTALLLVTYAAVPLGAYFAFAPLPQLIQLAFITLITVCAMQFGSRVSILDSRFSSTAARLRLPERAFILVIWLVMLAFVVVTFATAPSIPLISALAGRPDADISQERGDFLKGREGAGLALLYISTFLTNTFVPYSVVVLYARRSSWRHIAATAFFLFCISFMQKALFLNLFLPLLALLAAQGRLKTRQLLVMVGASSLLLIAATALSVDGSAGDSAAMEGGDFLSALYAPTGPIDYFVWRAFAVPVFTAVDTLVVHAEQFGGQMLLGATSSLLSSLFGIERINLERFVFEHQFGSWNEIANSNAVFVTDAYVNFGFPGSIVFGLFVGLTFRWFRISRDIAFVSLWPLFAFVLFSSPLIGMLLSNGFLIMLLHALFVRLPSTEKHSADGSRTA